MKKLLVVLTMLSMVFSIMAGCTTKGNDVKEPTAGSTTVSATSGTATDTTAKKKLSILAGTNWPLPADVDPNSNQWADIFKQALPDIEINWIIVPSTGLAEKKSLLMGSGNMPDMLVATQVELMQWADNELIQPLDDVIDQYYTVKDLYLSQETWKAVTYKGKRWAIMTPHSPLENPNALLVRKDWLANLNLTAPVTIDDFYNVCAAFTTQDPDKNGKNDTFGIAGTKGLGNLVPIFLAYGVDPVEGFWSRVDGKLTPDYIRPETKDALAFINKLYKSGYYDKDSLALEFSQLEEKATSSKTGFMVFPSSGTASRVNFNLKKNVSNGEFISCEPPVGPNGSRGISLGLDYLNTFVVTKTCKYPDAAVRVINWMLEKDTTVEYNAINADRIGCGEMGVTGTLLDNKWPATMPDGKLTDELKKEIYRRSYWFLTMGIAQIAPKDDIFDLHKAYIEAGNATENYYTDAVLASKYGVQTKRLIAGSKAAEYEAQLYTYFNETMMKIVTGEQPLNAFDTWVEYFYKNGGSEIIEEANDMN